MNDCFSRFAEFLSGLDDHRVETLYNLALRNQAEYLIWEFCINNYGDDSKLDLYQNRIDCAFTEWEDPESLDHYYITVTLDLERFEVIVSADDSVIRVDHYNSMEDFMENVLKNLDFDDLVALSEKDIRKIRKERRITDGKLYQRSAETFIDQL